MKNPDKSPAIDNDGLLDEKTRLNFELLIRLLKAGLDDRNQSITILTGKVKSSLATGAVVLGIIIAGMGIMLNAWIVNNPEGLMATQLLHSYVLLIGLFVGSYGITLILFSMYKSMTALNIVKFQSASSSRTVLTDERIDAAKMEIWKYTDEEIIYEKICEAYGTAMQSREESIHKMVPIAHKSHQFLVSGLALSAIAAAILVIPLILAHISV